MKKQSLVRRTIRTAIISGIALAVVALLIGLGIYGSTQVKQYVSRSFEIASYAKEAVTRSADPISPSKQVMEIYRSLTPEQRESEDYLRCYSDIDTLIDNDSNYSVLYHMLHTYIIDVDDVYLGMYDQETNALVYIVDPDPNSEAQMKPGEWEAVSEEECLRFLNWDGLGKLYDISRTEKYGWMCSAGCPIEDENGEICAFVLVDVTLESVVAGMNDYALKISLGLLFATAFITWLVVRHMKKTIAEPINGITKAATAYVKDKKDGVDKLHFMNLGIKAGDEIKNLTEVMADMEHELAEHEERITRITAEKERINSELNMGKRIQESMMPNAFPPFPERSEFDIFASMIPAREVGGDFYDYLLVDDDHLYMVIADVAGKGVPAALFMMMAKIILGNHAMLHMSPAQILTETNTAICDHNQEEMFVTVWLGILEISTGKLVAANAGHEYPVLKKADGVYTLVKDKHGLVVGGMEGIQYKEYELQLAPGDKMFFYTDGVPEATDGNNQMFGTDRMLAALNTVPEASPEQTLKNVQKAVDEFVKDAEQFDDMTMFCIEYLGTSKKGDGRMKELTLAATVENVASVLAFLDAELESADCPMRTQMQIEVAVEEIFTNIANYAYAPETGMVTVQIEKSEEPPAVTITFMDRGVPYNPLEKDDPDVTLSADEREIGGLGIFMTKKIMDEMSYEYKDNQNVLKLVKGF